MAAGAVWKRTVKKQQQRYFEKFKARMVQRMVGPGRLSAELDIESFFDTIDHSQLREILRKRVRDGVVLRLEESG